MNHLKLKRLYFMTLAVAKQHGKDLSYKAWLDSYLRCVQAEIHNDEVRLTLVAKALAGQIHLMLANDGPGRKYSQSNKLLARNGFGKLCQRNS